MKDNTSKIKSEIANAAQDAIRLIAQAAQDAGKLLANAANEARTVITSREADAAKLLVVKNADGSSDHDTQIKLVEAVANLDTKFSEKFADLKLDIRNLSDGTSKQIADHEIRINKLETSKSTQNISDQPKSIC